MNKIITLFLFVTGTFSAYGQCSTVSVQISASDTSYVQLYHAGFFLIPSGFANICEWEVTSFSGEILHQETTSGDFNDQSNVYFDHSIPLTDSMKATIVITNNIEGITCTMSDTLYWKETEVLPGVFIGNWDVLSSNGGIEEDITTSIEVTSDIQQFSLYPSPTQGYFNIESDIDIFSFSIFDLNGQTLDTFNKVHSPENVDISNYPAGIYFVRFWDDKNRYLGVKKIVKL